MTNKISVVIRVLAVILLVVGVIASLIMGIYAIPERPLWGVGIIAGGIFMTMLLSSYFYGFGELVSDLSEIRRNKH